MTNDELVKRLYDVSDKLEAIEAFFGISGSYSDKIEISSGAATGFYKILGETISKLSKIIEEIPSDRTK